MVKKILAPASIMHLAGADVSARNVTKFIFTCQACSDGTQNTIYASVEATSNGEVTVCDYEGISGQIPGMGQYTAMLFPDSNSVDEGTVEVLYRANFDSRTQ